MTRFDGVHSQPASGLKAQRNPPHKAPSRWMKRTWWFGCALILIYFTSWFGLPWLVRLPKPLDLSEKTSIQYLDRHGKPLRVLMIEGRRELEPLQSHEIPVLMQQAILAAEDQRFFEHHGIDFLSLLRAIKQNVTSGRVVSGASTITQQLIKISQLEEDRAQGKNARRRSLKTKIFEMLAARQLEMRWDKSRILTEYLNRLDYGNQFRGINTAAAGYFGKAPHVLSPAECALIAAIPQSPTRLNPWKNPDAALQRRNLLLRLPALKNHLSHDELEIALKEPIQLRRQLFTFKFPHAISQFEKEKSHETSSIPQHGKIHTTLDLELQRQIEKIIHQQLHTHSIHHSQSHPQVAVVVIHNENSELHALVGSRDFHEKQGGQVNGAWALRSPGSALKPFTYALAFNRGFQPGTLIPDLPSRYVTPTGEYRPINYDRRYYGPVTCREALGNSLNVSTVHLLNELGGAEIFMDLLKNYGITSFDRPASHYGLGMTIGNAEVRLIELTNAYAALARLGEWKPLQFVLSDSNLAPPKPVSDPMGESLTTEACWMVADVLSDPFARARTFGLESPIRLPFRVAVKTGTSTDYRDNWTIGYTPEWTVGVWVGNFDNSPMPGVSGVSGAGPIFAEIMKSIAQKHGVSWYPPHPNLVSRELDLRLGKIIPEKALPDWPKDRPKKSEYFIKNAPFPIVSDADYDGNERAILPERYRDWISGPHNRLGSRVTVPSLAHEKSDRPALLENHFQDPIILFPPDGSVFYLDPDLPQNGSKVLLESNLNKSRRFVWSSPTLRITEENSQIFLNLTPGQHEIKLSDLDRQISVQNRIKVESR